MNSIVRIAKNAERLAADNSPTILTVIGVVGTVTTAVLTGKAAVKADHLYTSDINLQAAVYDPERDVTEVPMFTKTKYVWKLYIPAASMGILTVASIVGANRIGNRRTAALAAAYTISEKAYVEYKDKVIEKFGEGKERAVRDDIAQDRVSKSTPDSTIVVGEAEVLCYDSLTGRYFKSTMETLKKAQNDTNYQLLNEDYVSLTEFYNRIGLPQTDYSEEVGWRSDKMLEIEFSTVLSEDGKPCISISFTTIPVRGYYKVF